MARRIENNKQYLYEAIWIFCSIMLVCSLILWFRTWRNSRRFGPDWYERSRVWRKELLKLLGLGILSCGAGLIFWLLALWRYRFWRTRRRKCPHCGGKMKRLGEEEDNAYLNSAQDTEEQLGTVDYDVWLCPACGEVDIFAFEKNQKTYENCPDCNAKAYAVTSERIVRRPTSRQAGVGVRTKVCRHCGHTDDENFNIPPEDGGGRSADASMIAGAALGSLLSRGGGGGFSGGGGWGGGSFGGGGASGKW